MTKTNLKCPCPNSKCELHGRCAECRLDHHGKGMYCKLPQWHKRINNAICTVLKMR